MLPASRAPPVQPLLPRCPTGGAGSWALHPPALAAWDEQRRPGRPSLLAVLALPEPACLLPAPARLGGPHFGSRMGSGFSRVPSRAHHLPPGLSQPGFWRLVAACVSLPAAAFPLVGSRRASCAFELPPQGRRCGFRGVGVTSEVAVSVCVQLPVRGGPRPSGVKAEDSLGRAVGPRAAVVCPRVAGSSARHREGALRRFLLCSR